MSISTDLSGVSSLLKLQGHLLCPEHSKAPKASVLSFHSSRTYGKYRNETDAIGKLILVWKKKMGRTSVGGDDKKRNSRQNSV